VVSRLTVVKGGTMGFGLLGCGGIAILALLLVVALVAIYNRLVVLRNRVENAWSQIDVQLRRRYDLIPNLVETVKGYAAHESNVFQKVTEARSAAMGAQSVKEQSQAENVLTDTLKSLFAVAEAYPQLKANENFMMLQEELSGTESKIAYARQFYNDSVMSFNTALQTFPNNVIAGMFNFKERDYFEIEAAAAEPVKVSFS
jgi:LemA protein